MCVWFGFLFVDVFRQEYKLVCGVAVRMERPLRCSVELQLVTMDVGLPNMCSVVVCSDETWCGFGTVVMRVHHVD